MATSKEAALYSRILAEKEDAKKRLKVGQTRARPGPGRPVDLNLDDTQPLILPTPLPLSVSQGALSQARRGDGALKLSQSSGALGGNAQIARLKVTVQTLRDEISAERHELAALEREAQKNESEATFMSYEDDIVEQREQGVKQMQDKKDELLSLDNKHLEALAYNSVLVFMEKRLLKQKITFHGTLGGYEEALKLNHAEARQVRQQLLDARKARQDEEHLLAKYQSAVRRHRAALEEQLEKLRTEATQRESVLELGDMSRKPEALDVSADSLDGEDAANFGKPWAPLPQQQPQAPAPHSQEAETKYKALKAQMGRVLSAAGVVGKAGLAGDLISRHDEVVSERDQLDRQLFELRSHMDHLLEFQHQLRVRAEPKGNDRVSSAADARGHKLDQASRLESVRRVFSLGKEELDQLRATKVQLEQSIEALSGRLTKFVSLPNEFNSSEVQRELASEITRVSQRLVALANAVKDEVSGSGSIRQTARAVGRTESPKPTVYHRQRSSSTVQFEKEGELAVKKELLLASATSVGPKSEYNIRIRPGSASGVAKLSAKQLAAAAETFATVQAKLSTSMSSGYGRLSPLKKSGLSISVGGDFLDSKTVDEDIPYTDSITDAGSRILAEVGISFDVPDSDGEDAEKQRTQGGSSFAALEASRRRRKSRDIQIPLDDTLDAKGSSSRKNKRQLQLLKCTAAAAMMAGDEPDEASMPVKDTELVPTRDMVKHKARVVVQRLQKQKKAAGKAEGGDSGKLAE